MSQEQEIAPPQRRSQQPQRPTQGTVINRNAGLQSDTGPGEDPPAAPPQLPPPPGYDATKVKHAAEMTLKDGQKGEWVEPDIPDMRDKENLTLGDQKPVKYQELLNKVFRRSDKPDSPRRYQPIGLWKKFTQPAEDPNSPEGCWMLQVWVFVYTDLVGDNGKLKRRTMGSSKIPGQFSVEANTFKRLYEIESEGE